ncbi:MAG: GAF domain-containing protein, partial [Chloroflexota bacterium]
MTEKTNGKPRTTGSAYNIVSDFDEMVSGLRGMLDTLQQRVVTLTTDLQVAADISTDVAKQQDLDAMLPAMATSVRDRFELYHAHVYLLDEDGATLQLAAGSGEVGEQMRKQGHSISLNAQRSLVARAARERDVVVVNDVLSEPGWLPNPLLPNTRAEMAVPMVVGDTLIGVLDVQSEKIDRFDDADREVKTTLAGQVAVSIANARSLALRERQERREAVAYEIGRILNTEMESSSLLQLAVDELAKAFDYYHAHIYTYDDEDQRLIVAAGLGEAGKVMSQRGHNIPYNAETSLVAQAARTLQPVIATDVTEAEDHLPNPL